jgi:hypothetical protein
MTEASHNEETDPISDRAEWVQVAHDNPTVGELGELLTWLTEHQFSHEAIQDTARWSRQLAADSKADIPQTYFTLDEQLQDLGLDKVIIPMVDRLRARNGAAAIAQVALPSIPTATTDALGRLCEHLFHSCEISLTGENYLSWARLAQGAGTVRDLGFLVHELHELDRVLRSGYQPHGRGASAYDDDAWGEVYDVQHAAALDAEYGFLAGKLATLTDGEAAWTAQEFAAADPGRAEGREKYFGERATAQHKQAADTQVQLSGPMQLKLHLATATPTRAQLIAAFKALSATALAS